MRSSTRLVLFLVFITVLVMGLVALSLDRANDRDDFVLGSNKVKRLSNFISSESDRFTPQINASSVALFKSQPTAGKCSNEPCLRACRGMDWRDDRFARVVCGGLSLDSVHHSFSKLQIGHKGGVVLRLMSMNWTGHAPYFDRSSRTTPYKLSTEPLQSVQRDPQPRTRTSEPSSVGNIQRPHIYSKLPGYPYISHVGYTANAGMAQQVFQVPWYSAFKFRIIFCIALVLISGVGVFVLRRVWQRHGQVLAALHSSEARTRQVVAAALDGVVHINTSGVITDWNQSAERLFGWPVDFAIGRSLKDLSFFPHKNSAKCYDLIRQLSSNTRATIEKNRFESWVQHRDGHQFSAELSIVPVAFESSREYSVFVRDISAFKTQQSIAVVLEQDRERCRLAMDAGPEGLWDWDIASGTGYFSPTYYKLLGYTDQEFPITERIGLSQLHPEDRRRIVAIVRDCSENRTVKFEAEYRMRAKDGSYKWILGRGSAVLRDAHGRALRLIGTHRDISLHKSAQQALWVAKSDAEAANSAKSRFLAAACHDLLQPLSAISLYTDVLLARTSPDDSALLKNMSLCVVSVNTLLTDLLDISRLDAGAVAPVTRDFPVADMLSGLAAVHGPAARQNGLRLRCRPTHWNARTDPVLITRILNNLITNAIRYTEFGDVLIACRRRQNKTWIEVWDTGIGIPEDKTKVIFEEYCQLKPNHCSRGNTSIGSGLGLAIVAKAAALLNLRIRVQSRLGQGSMFAIELPLGRIAEPTPMDIK